MEVEEDWTHLIQKGVKAAKKHISAWQGMRVYKKDHFVCDGYPTN